jgi:hypothetical protein
MDTAIQLLLTAALAGAGGYFGSYFREKGKNLATREDLEPIVRGQETIKQQIAHSGFVEQRRWELKREIIWDLQKTLADMMAASIELNALSHGTSTSTNSQLQLDRLLAAALKTASLRAMAGSLIEDPLGEQLDEAVLGACASLPRDVMLGDAEFRAMNSRIRSAILRVQVLAREILFRPKEP